ncbi:hypothetical protein NUW54_g12063 [Trametes sanguinea]|uniref:Uncharacterized protein n=1 Tax=Trametes sanguinea TaxID=158606 RepID=A0ACC1N3L0_9APHY|nr:hypothetical protein NUW54_g12063 [Trametes sanguinea]
MREGRRAGKEGVEVDEEMSGRTGQDAWRPTDANAGLPFRASLISHPSSVRARPLKLGVAATASDRDDDDDDRDVDDHGDDPTPTALAQQLWLYTFVAPHGAETLGVPERGTRRTCIPRSLETEYLKISASEDLDLSHVEFSCLPSGLHLIERDVVYFTKDDHQGVCVFRRRQTTEHGHRGFRLSSLGVLLAKSPRPRPWKHVAALKALVNTIYSALEDREALEPLDEDWEPARTFFEERKLRRSDSGDMGPWLGWNAELEGPHSDTSPTVHLPHLLRILGPSSLTLYKHILGRRRVLIITLPPVEAACILCQVAADTCYQEQVSELVSAADSQDGDEDTQTSRRLKGRSNAGVKVLGMVTLNDMDKLEFESKSGRGWIACTTDSIFLDKPAYYDLLIDLRSATPNTRPTFHVSKPVEQPNGRGVSYRLSSVRFTWSDVRLVSSFLSFASASRSQNSRTIKWTELERVLQLDSEDSLDTCCDPSTHTGKGLRWPRRHMLDHLEASRTRNPNPPHYLTALARGSSSMLALHPGRHHNFHTRTRLPRSSTPRHPDIRGRTTIRPPSCIHLHMVTITARPLLE